MSSDTTPPDAEGLEQAFLFILRHLRRPLSASALRSRVARPSGPWTLTDVCEGAESLGVEALSRSLPQALATVAADPVLVLLAERRWAVLLGPRERGQHQLFVPGQGLTECDPDTLALAPGTESVQFSLRLQSRLPGDAPQGRYGHWFLGPVLQARPLYLQVALAALMINLFALATSIFSMIVYDRVIPNHATDTLVALLIGAAVVFASDFVIRSLRGYFLDVAGTRADMVIGDTLFEQVLDMQMAARKGPTGALANVLKEFESLREFLTSTTLVTLIDIPFAVVFLLVIGSIGGPVVWVPLLAIPLMVGSGWLIQPRMRRLVSQSQQDGHHKQAVLVETLSGLETIKSLGAGALMRRRWQEAVTHQSHVGLKQRMLTSFAANMANLSQQLVQVGVITVGFYLVTEGRLGFGAVTACTLLAGRAIAPLAQLSQLLARLNQSLASYRALSEFMRLPREHEPQVDFVARERFEGSIEFRNVSFTYPGASRPTLRNVSFRIEAGEKVAVLGRIGSGKTTLAKLILGLYQPQEGAVLIDGVDVRQVDPAELRHHVGAVLQDVWLMTGTLKENITLGVDSVSDARLLEAARIAGVEDFASQHPQGYQMRLGERGEGLSGGQRQAVTIARALVSEPAILVMDEPTSSMDVNAEQQLVGRLRDYVQPRTLLVITHKPSMVAMASKVLVLEQGQIAYAGPPEKVLAGAKA